jgi:hypothetical protein
MKTTLICILGLSALVLTACAKPEDRIVEIPNGKFKIDIRYREYMKSGTINVDVCVADRASTEFPTDGEQCFFHGFDFNKVSAEWVSDSNVVITFECGYLTVYQNFASIREGREISDDFNAKLIDTCHTYLWDPSKLSPPPHFPAN